MKRKIIKQGHNTLTLTLPSEWARKLNLHGGDEIDIQEREDTLIVNAPYNHKSKSCTIDITGFTVPLLWRYFQSAYRAGCDEIKIIFDEHKKEYEDAYNYYTTQFEYSKLGERVPAQPAIAMIQGVTNRFIGIDIMETGKNYCIIREMAELSLKEFDHSLRRIFLIIQQLFEKTIDTIEHNNIGHSSICKEIHAIDLNIDKLVDYCARMMNKINNHFPEAKKSAIFSSLFLLELVGDEFKYIGKHLALSTKSVKDTVPLIRMAREHFNLYYKLYYAFDRKTAVTFGESDCNIYMTHFKTKGKMKGESRSISQHIMLISKLTLALVELRIQMEF